MSVGTSTLVCSLNTGEKPCEKYRVWRALVRVFHQICSEETHLALGEERLDARPRLALRSVTEPVHDDCALLDGLVDLEQVLAGDPSVLLRLLPAGAVLAHTDDDVQAVVTQVETLAVALRTVTDEGEGVVLEVVLHITSQLRV